MQRSPPPSSTWLSVCASVQAREIVGLTGGVFQNRRLSELASARLLEGGFEVLLPQQLPCNDGGLSYGQVAEFAARND